MKCATIHLHGLPGIDQPEAVKTVYFSDIAALKSHLTNLQMAYCDNDGERPEITEYAHPETKKKILDCHSDADFHYVARLGYKLKESANKPVEYI